MCQDSGKAVNWGSVGVIHPRFYQGDLTPGDRSCCWGTAEHWEAGGEGTPTSVCELVKRIKGFKEGRTFVGDWLAGNLPALPPNGLPRQGQDRLLTTPAC